MARWGSTDYRQLQRLQQRIERLAQSDLDAFCRDMANELALRMLAKVKRRTPVISGQLRRSWHINLGVYKMGNTYYITVDNSALYASYVEYGHRQEPGRYVPAIGKRLKKAWVRGRFMMTISAQDVEGEAPRLIERALLQYLRGVFDG